MWSHDEGSTLPQDVMWSHDERSTLPQDVMWSHDEGSTLPQDGYCGHMTRGLHYHRMVMSSLDEGPVLAHVPKVVLSRHPSTVTRYV